MNPLSVTLRVTPVVGAITSFAVIAHADPPLGTLTIDTTVTTPMTVGVIRDVDGWPVTGSERCLTPCTLSLLPGSYRVYPRGGLRPFHVVPLGLDGTRVRIDPHMDGLMIAGGLGILVGIVGAAVSFSTAFGLGHCTPFAAGCDIHTAGTVAGLSLFAVGLTVSLVADWRHVVFQVGAAQR